MQKQPLIILTGPTAVGKTKASIGLAKAIGGEIISADSMQVYKYMDIGSAKIRPEEMQYVPHYLVDELEPDDEFHVVRFQQMAKEAMKKIYAAGHIPIVVGGTGFYIQALLYDIDFTDNDNDTSLRAELESFAKEHGAEALHEKLREVDQKSAETIHANNIKRVIRALEFYQRVDQMIEEGLVAEVKALKARGYDRSMVSMQGLGYKEILDYLDGACTLEDAIYKIKRDTRHFAKRQITWFKREKHVTWINKKDYNYDEDKILEVMLESIKKDILEEQSC